ncbi:D-glycero-alpha-D-manno-heptose-1,7-bisphosphate 7-phosphatase [Lysobacter panacisoli]|uniref:D,D-heptose 1,7-bisphosphate phosphatase n=1 Tax=Lysobacter panacisoli TaxID=1255263 RepID=A0ABP9L820_9GAMM|nr:HAD family hydrolase [Lysobacter panacisoli]
MSVPGCGVFEDDITPRVLQELAAPRRALFLDRDGIINVDHGYVHRGEDTQWMPGIFELSRMAIDAGCLVVVVTNQAGIARGYYDDQQFLAYTRWVHGEFKARGAALHATCYCPHHPDAVDPQARTCECRKPAPGMILEAARRYGIALGESALLGDKSWDVQAGRSAGVGLNLLLEGDGDPAPGTVRSLGEAEHILRKYFASPKGATDVRI